MTYFSESYETSRRRFREEAKCRGWRLRHHPIAAAGPGGETLTIDVAVRGADAPSSTLVASSGLHGVEGFFGSAVQLQLLQTDVVDSLPPSTRVVLIHALNPYGFAWLRRVNEDNVDPNRNFLLPDQEYAGRPDLYHRIEPLLNPPSPPGRYDLFLLHAAGASLRFGFGALKQAVAQGQYEYAKGLFFGGRHKCESADIFERNFHDWVGRASRVLHLDFHTGLGKSADYKLLIGYALDAPQRAWLEGGFGQDRIEDNDPAKTSYECKGDLGYWCRRRYSDGDYYYLCAEFGTAHPLLVLSALRSENQLHHWQNGAATPDHWAKRLLVDRFCPRSRKWRQTALENARQLIQTACKLISF